MVRRLVRTEFKFSWQFKIEIEGQPSDLDIYVKDITYGPTEISNEAIKVGSRALTFPTQAQPVSLSMTVRDNIDERVSKFFDSLASQTVNPDGTVNLPFGANGYVKKVTRYNLQEDGTEKLMDTWHMFAVQRGDVTESREDANFLEFPITFIQFRS